jgi:hypothetical protein
MKRLKLTRAEGKRVAPCPKHPRYTAARDPRCDCPACWALRRWVTAVVVGYR